jgi:1-acyl-sn-glycerol-3-phosphate acyltransferase
MIRSIYISCWVAVSTFCLGCMAILLSLFGLTGNPIHKIAEVWARSILAVSGIDVTVNGLSNVDPAKSYIYMSNHQSNVDIWVLLAHLPVQFRWLAKAELFKIPILSRSMRAAGYISINRFDKQSAFNSIDQAAEKIKEGVSVMIFPEGTRSFDGKIRSFKKGGFVLAVKSGVPVVPVIIHGTFSIMPKGSLRVKPGSVVLEIQKPIDTGGYTFESKDALIERVRHVICESFEKGKEDGASC